MNKPWTRLLAALLWSVLLSASQAVQAQSNPYPTRPVRVFVGFGPGGISDVIIRIVSEEVGNRLGQSLVIENRPGANGVLAAQAVKRAPPDGYSIFGGSVASFSKVFMKDLGLAAAEELAPISMLATGNQFLYVSAALPIRNLQELASYAKANRIRFASQAPNNSMIMAIVAKRMGFPQETIPYKTTEQVLAALLTGDAHVSVNAAGGGYGVHVEAGKLRPITNLAAQRSTDVLTAVPTAREQGVDIETQVMMAYWASPGTPAALVKRLQDATADAVRNPAVAEKIRKAGYTATSSTPEELLRRTEADARLLTEAAQAIGFTPQ